MNPVKKTLLHSILFLYLFFPGVGIKAQNAKKTQLINFKDTWTSPYVVDPDYRHHFINGEGNHLYLYNKSAFAYFKCKNPSTVLDKAKKHGANVIRVCLEGTPFFKELKQDLWPWGGTRSKPNWNTFRESYWSEVENRIKLAGESGIGLDIILYYTLHPSKQDVANQRKYWDYAIKRLGKYANVFSWEIMYNVNRQKEFTDIAGTYFKTRDPYQRPVFTSGPASDDAFMPWKFWMDVAVVRTPTGNQPMYNLKDWYLAIARNTYNHGKPAFNVQPGREMVDENDDPVFRRKQGWLWCSAGAYWSWHSYDGCEGIDETNYFSPGWQYSKPISNFFKSLPFWSMNPNYTACHINNPELISVSLATPGRETIILYACSNETSTFERNNTISLHLPNGKYAVSFFRPSDLNKIKTVDIEASGINNLLEIDVPDFNDDILIKVTRN